LVIVLIKEFILNSYQPIKIWKNSVLLFDSAIDYHQWNKKNCLWCKNVVTCE